MNFEALLVWALHLDCILSTAFFPSQQLHFEDGGSRIFVFGVDDQIVNLLLVKAFDSL